MNTRWRKRSDKPAAQRRRGAEEDCPVEQRGTAERDLWVPNMAAAEHRYKQDAREREREGGSFSVRVNHVCTFLSSETCEQQEFCWRGARGGVSLTPPVMTVICPGFQTLLFL